MSEGKIDRSQIIIGLLLVCLGLLFLLNTFGYLSWNTWEVLFRFWPVILIIGGLNVLLKNTKMWWIVPILIILIFTGLVMTSNQNLFFEKGKNYSGSYSTDRSLNEDLKNLKVDVNCKAGKLRLAAVRDKNRLYNMDLNYKNNKPAFSYNIENSTTGHLSLEQKAKFNFGKSLTGANWDLFLTEEIPLAINIEAGAGKIDLDLRQLRVKQLNIDSGVSDLNLQLNNYDTNVEINSGASNIKIFIPATAGLRITTSSVINNSNFEEAGLIKLYEDVYQSKNFGEVGHHIKMDISTSASNINLIYQ
ncbi:MAG: DUF5668 domain-containing protein [Halanaerobiales bacterium]|nr:DUF5668 domain-containing protein [Halanaerobiales bacterium]